MMGDLLNAGNRPLANLLNRSRDWLGSQGLTGINLICNKFFIVLFMNLMQNSTCPLFWWLYDEDSACQMPSFLQKFSNFMPVSETILLGSQYFENIILQVFIRLSALKSPSVL